MPLEPIDGLQRLSGDKKKDQPKPEDLDTPVELEADEAATEEEEKAKAEAEKARKEAEALEAIELEADEDSEAGPSQIRMFGKSKRHDEQWSREPNVTGQGAIHCRTFHAKLREDALEFMDKQINEWLDAHPEYEVKLVTSSVGELKGKLVEPALFLTVWV